MTAIWPGFRREREDPRRQVYGAALRVTETGQRQLVEVGPWRGWMGQHFPEKTTFAARHIRLWDWFASLQPGVPQPARVEPWPRGGAKSTTVELATTYVGDRKTRRFALYLSDTQAQANKHVGAIGHNFEMIGQSRALNKYGISRGWTSSMLRVANGFNVLALGLDAAARGIKLEDFRPDLIILDDVDDRHDTEAAVLKKILTITDTILPTGSVDAAVVFVQNLVHAKSIMSQLVERTADFLLRREMTEPEPAVRGLEYEPVPNPVTGITEYRITAGTPTWGGQSLKTAEHQMNTWGLSSFLREGQQDLSARGFGLWQKERDLDPYRAGPGYAVERPATFRRIVVAIDPNSTSTGHQDEAGIVVVGDAILGRFKGERVQHAYLLEDGTVKGGPLVWARAAVATYLRWQANALVAEANNGGDMVAITLSTVPGAPKVILVYAARGKMTRAEPVQKLAEEGRLHHCGVFPHLETELCNWVPGEPSPNRLDAYVWAVSYLFKLGKQEGSKHSGQAPLGMRLPAAAPQASTFRRR